MRFLDAVKPVMCVMPEVQAPTTKIPFKEKAMWTLVTLFIFLVCCQIPLYGIKSNSSSDPLYWVRRNVCFHLIVNTASLKERTHFYF